MNPNTWRIVLDIGTAAFIAAVVIALAWWSLRKSVDPASLLFKWILSVVVVGGMILICQHVPPVVWPVLMVPVGIIFAITWAPGLGSMLISPLTNAIDGGNVPLEAQAFYSIAETKRRNGHPQEAILAVREQLEKFPGDFYGTTLLASIQAEDMNDLPGALLTFERWLEGPWATPQGKATILTMMADWHLQYAQDPEAARLALEKIVEQMPDTPAAHHAAQRLAHLPTVEDLVAAKTGAPVDLQPGDKFVGLLKDYKGPSGAPVPEPAALADEYVKQLEKHPADTATREKLAVLYAEHFQRLDLAADQLEQLISFPNETPRHVVQWLNLLADLQIRYGKDLPAADAALRRILEMYSTPALVEPAISRLASLEAELKRGRTTPVKTLGHYEKNIGLKKGAPDLSGRHIRPVP
jgi:tetratricopeptide (TPR) repeat protein